MEIWQLPVSESLFGTLYHDSAKPQLQRINYTSRVDCFVQMFAILSTLSLCQPFATIKYKSKDSVYQLSDMCVCVCVFVCVWVGWWVVVGLGVRVWVGMWV